MGQNDNPKETAFELVAQVPGQTQKSGTPRKRKARPRQSNKHQLALPGLLPTGDESKA